MCSINGYDIPHRLPKLCGADIELGNFILGSEEPGSTGREASRSLLREFDGLPPPRQFPIHGSGPSIACQMRPTEFHGWGYSPSPSLPDSGSDCGPVNPQDWGRKFLPSNGGCAYVDLDHIEICLPEIISAWDFVAAWHAMLRITRLALSEANRYRAANRRVQVLVNNSDGQNNSYGSHINFLITRRAWDNLFYRKMHQLLFLATYQVSSIIYAGQGKVGSENGAPPVAYQLSQRADFLETLLGPQTTFNRPIINSRDEPLCGRAGQKEPELARLHVIFFDSTLCQVASLLKVGVMQIILSMIEADCVNARLSLDDPVNALSCFSHDPTMEARVRTVMGQNLSALELQFLFLDEAVKFTAQGGCKGIVPRAEEILDLWGDTLRKIKKRDFSELSRRIDWVLKLQILARAMDQQPELSWDSPQIRYLDQLYSSLDEGEGLYWAYERNGFVEEVVREEHIEKLMNNPPADTRAYARAMLLRSADPSQVEAVDWDSITFNVRGTNYLHDRRTVDLTDPLQHSKKMTEHCFRRSESLEEILDAYKAPGHQFRRRLHMESGSQAGIT